MLRSFFERADCASMFFQSTAPALCKSPYERGRRGRGTDTPRGLHDKRRLVMASIGDPVLFLTSRAVASAGDRPIRLERLGRAHATRVTGAQFRLRRAWPESRQDAEGRRSRSPCLGPPFLASCANSWRGGSQPIRRRERLGRRKASTQKMLDDGRQSSRHKSSVLSLRTRRLEIYSFNAGREH